jgi:sterol 24-C-methyltransferase
MSTSLIVRENHERDAAFSQTLHGRSAEQKSAFMAMLSKDSGAQQVAADAYFHHWDNKDANIETKEDREVSMTDRLKSLSTPS